MIPRNRRVGATLMLMVIAVGATFAATAIASRQPAAKHKKATPPPPSYAEAYGYVAPRGVANGEDIVNSPGPHGVPTGPELYPLYRVKSYAPTTAKPGAYCFKAGHASPGTSSVVVVSVVGDAPAGAPVAYADWVKGAPSCAPGQFEIQAGEYVVQGGAIVAQPSDKVGFSFVIP
jgi:hypothetical protein